MMTLTNNKGEKTRSSSTLPRLSHRPDSMAQVVACKRLAKMPILFLAVRYIHSFK